MPQVQDSALVLYGQAIINTPRTNFETKALEGATVTVIGVEGMTVVKLSQEQVNELHGGPKPLDTIVWLVRPRPYDVQGDRGRATGMSVTLVKPVSEGDLDALTSAWSRIHGGVTAVA